MRGREELVLRCAQRRAKELGGLSKEGYQELLLAVRSHVDSFVSTASERAFARLVSALERYEADGEDDDLLDDEEYLKARKRRFDALELACKAALEEDPGCLDARLVRVLVADMDAPELLDALLRLDAENAERIRELAEAGRARRAARGTEGPEGVGVGTEGVAPDEAEGDAGAPDAWDDVGLRPALRVRAAAARACINTTHFRLARDLCSTLLDAAPSDCLGARHTLEIVCARLEDEPAFDELQARFSHAGSAWSHLMHALLLYKLDRMGAARRALQGYSTLCEGGAFALLRPAFVDSYLPDRPEAAPNSFAESMMAVAEADPVIVDAPDFVAWAQSQPGIVESARRFADERGYDW